MDTQEQKNSSIHPNENGRDPDYAFLYYLINSDMSLYSLVIWLP